MTGKFYGMKKVFITASLVLTLFSLYSQNLSGVLNAPSRIYYSIDPLIDNNTSLVRGERIEIVDFEQDKSKRIYYKTIYKGDTVYIDKYYVDVISRPTKKELNNIRNKVFDYDYGYSYSKNSSFRNIGIFKAGDSIPIIGYESVGYKDFYKAVKNGEIVFITVKAKDSFINDLRSKRVRSKCDYDKNIVDEFTGEKKVFLKKYNLETYGSYYNGELSLELRRSGNSKYIWFYSNKDLGCVSSYKANRASVKFKLENGVIVSFYHFGDVDCSEFSIIANLTAGDISKLKKSPIKSIRLSGSKYYHDITNVKWKTFFIDKLNCIN